MTCDNCVETIARSLTAPRRTAGVVIQNLGQPVCKLVAVVPVPGVLAIFGPVITGALFDAVYR